MQDDYRWMPDAMFAMATTCRNEGMTAACNLLTESAILLHVCLSQRQNLPHGPSREQAIESEGGDRVHLQDAISSRMQDKNAQRAGVRVLHPRASAQQNGRARA